MPFGVYSPSTTHESGDTYTKRLIVLALLLLPLAVLGGRAAHETSGLNNQGPDGLPEVSCASSNYTEIYLSPPPPVSIGKYFTTQEISIEAVGQVHISTRSGQYQPCIPMIADITSTQWQLVSKPPGSSATLTTNDLFNGKFTPDIDGTYVVRMVACALGCHMVFPGLTPFDIESVERDATFITSSELPFPPQTDVVLPAYSQGCQVPGFFPCDQQTDFPPHIRDLKCDSGGGLFDPQWVTVNEWHGLNDYYLLEGKVQKARISRKDAPMNHYSQDFNFKVLADLPYRYLVSTAPEDSPDPVSMGVEWEVNSYPEHFRPTVNDRVSVWGYWIHDCGHEPFYTEIHPPVGVAVHRPRPVLLPEFLGLGSNVFAPGVISDVWFNRNAGELTDNCSWTGLHQPYPPNGDDTCLPQEGGGPNPIAPRGYEYNIYLPPNPADTLAAAGHDNPPEVELYYDRVGFPVGFEPNIDVIPSGELTYLHVEIDLAGYTEDTYSGRIVAAWKYPAPDNWGMKQYEVSVDSIDVHEDSDITCHDLYCPFYIGGDWRMWVNIPNVEQEWTRILNCDECVFDDDNHGFGGNRWGTERPPGRNLGPHVNLFPGQLFSISFSGYDDDWGFETSDDVGFIQQVLPPPAEGTFFGWPNNVCNDSPDFEIPVTGTDVLVSHCSDYNVNWRLIPRGGVNASLTPDGQDLYDSLLVNVADLGGCAALVKIRCWDDRPGILDFLDILPEATRIPFPTKLTDIGLYKPQGVEDLTFTDIDPPRLKLEFLNATQAELDHFFERFTEDVENLPKDHVVWEFAVLEGVLPPAMYEEHFGHIDFLWPVWGDGDCDEDVDEMDVLRSLMVTARVKPGAPCLVQTNANCDDVYDVKDTLVLLKFTAGFDVTSPAGGQGADKDSICAEVGEEVHLEFDLPPATATPAPTTTPTATPMPTVTPTATATPTPTPIATPTAPPTATPAPTPDVTGPTITNVGANPDGNAPNWVFEHPAPPDFCQQTTTTISATISDPSGIAAVFLHVQYFDNGVSLGPDQGIAASFVAGKYQVVLDPPDVSSDMNGDIRWWFEAADASANNNVSVSPPGAPGTRNSTTITNCNPIT